MIFFFSSVKHKRRYFEEYGVTTLLVDPIGFHSKGKIYYGSQWGPINCLITNILQNILFSVQQKKETHTGLEHLEGE